MNSHLPGYTMQKIMAALVVFGILVGLPAPVPVFAQAGPDQALVVFHRPNKIKWKATRFNIEQGGRPIGQLLAGKEISLPLDPGSYTFTASAKSLDGMDYLTLNVKAGKTYRVKGEVLASWPVGRPKFTDVKESGVATQSTSAPAAVPAGSQSVPAASHDLKNFAGDWDMETWSLAADGRKLEGKGTATGSLEGEHAVRIVVNDFEAPEVPAAIGGGTLLISFHPEEGLSFESDLPAADRKLQFTGQFKSGKYVFYLFDGDGETITGMQRSSLRLEIQSINHEAWVAETYVSFEGQTTQVQSTRLTRR
jgi:hypothetical protein